jgi:hypothetical protein
MYEVVIPEIPGLDGSNPGISGLRKKSGIPGFGIPGLQSLSRGKWEIDITRWMKSLMAVERLDMSSMLHKNIHIHACSKLLRRRSS